MKFSLKQWQGDEYKIMKEVAIKIVNGDKIEKNYDFLNENNIMNQEFIKIKDTYRKILHQMNEGIVYDFYKESKKYENLYKFSYFKLVKKLEHIPPYYFYNGTEYQMIREEKYETCPICGDKYQEDEIKDHITKELSNDNENVTVVFDKSINGEFKDVKLKCNTVRELKKKIYEYSGISLSKQDIYYEGKILKNSDALNGEIVILKQKKREKK